VFNNLKVFIIVNFGPVPAVEQLQLQMQLLYLVFSATILFVGLHNSKADVKSNVTRSDKTSLIAHQNLT